jgi:ABC-2 type transport system permease protein
MRSMRKYLVLAEKGFSQNLVYVASHLINTVASAVFGLIYISLWVAVTPARGFSGYTPQTMVYYVAFNQVIMWLSTFGMRVHRKIVDAVRSGSVAQEISRPMSFLAYRVSTELGSQLYSFIFRGLPVGVMLSFFGFYFPMKPVTWLYTAIALVLACYIGVLLNYMSGITAFWTNEVRAAWWIVSTMSLGFGGASVPLEVFPDWFAGILRLSPFPCLIYYPARLYLEMDGPQVISYQLFWGAALTFVCQWLTVKAQRRLEVQGG